MPMTSYAQNHEDVLLARLFPRGLTGFYIDVGANDPLNNSITKYFYDLGWKGINVEPAREPFDRLVAARERDVNLNIGLSDKPGSLTFFEFPPEVVAVSTFSAAQAEWHRDNGIPAVERTVEVKTLADVCEEHVGGTIDLLSVDVEGLERQVLEGADWSRWRPRVVVVEATQPATTIPTHDQWEHLLLDSGYLFGAFDGLNRYYVRNEDSELLPALATPVNVTDDYVPYQYLKPIQDLRLGLDLTQRLLAATRARNDSLWAEYSSLPQELSLLRAEFERLDRSLSRARADYEELRSSLEAERAPYAELLEEVGPLGLGVARRLSRVSGRFPKAASSTKGLLRAVRRSIRSTTSR
jgi:FkbM family methyltransferase